MKNFKIFYAALFIITISGMKSISFAQSSPVMYFCERYDNNRGEIGISDRFTKGYLTVMVKADDPLRLRDCHIQFDRYNQYTNKFEFYKKYDYTVSPDMKYIYFARDKDNDLKFDNTGFFRVYLLDDDNNTIASSLIEII